MPNPYSFAVIGVIVSSISANSLAVFEDGTCLHVGGRYRDLVVSQIEYRWVTLTRGEYVARVMVGDPTPFAQRPELESRDNPDGSRHTRISEAYKADQLSLLNFAHILNQAGVEPYPGGGFRIYNIEPGSIYSRIGLRDDDVVDNINGYALTDAISAIRILRHLRDERRWVINLYRGLDEVTLVVETQ